MRNTLQWREAKWKTGRVWGWSVKGVEFPKNGFCKFILGSQGRRDEEMRKDKEPCCSVIWSLTEEKDRKSEEGKKERTTERKADRRRWKIHQWERESLWSRDFYSTRGFHNFIIDCFLRMAANYFLQKSASFDSFGRPALASIFFTVVILNDSPANTPPVRRWQLCI